MPGLFIQRQAEALTTWCDVAVIYVHPDPHCPNQVEVDFSEEHEVRVIRVYYRVNAGSRSFINQVRNFYQFYQAYMKAFKSIRGFNPDLVHSHVLTRMGWIGLKISRQLKVPLVISEHWSRYFPQNGTYQGWLRKKTTARIIKNAAAVIAVSEPLKNAMITCGLYHHNYRIIPNIAGFPAIQPVARERGADIKTMVHISCFEDKSKNISGFLRSLQALTVIRKDFRCLMVGDGPDWLDMKEYAGFLRIPDALIQFVGVKTGAAFDEILTGADFTVMSSNYETFGTVVIESLAAGVPVVATTTGIAKTKINDTNGILVPVADEKALTDALFQMLNLCREYDRETIRKSIGNEFSPEKVGEMLAGLYKEVINNQGYSG